MKKTLYTLGLLSVCVLLFVAAKAKETLKERAMATETIYFVPATIEPSYAKLFVHKVGKSDLPFIPKECSALLDNIETKELLMSGSDVDAFNDAAFEYLKSVFGDRVKHLPEEHVQLKEVRGRKYRDYDFRKIPYQFIVEANYMTRRDHNAMYLLMSADDLYEEGTLIKPSSHYDLSLSLIERTKEGNKGKVRATASYKLFGHHQGVYGEGSEKVGTHLDEEHLSDYFRWDPRYIDKVDSLEANYSAYIKHKQDIVVKRIDEVLPAFKKALEKALNE